jgi:Tryptophan-rich sensory protein (mitochondrial benzodiazepine receptor homolog)
MKIQWKKLIICIAIALITGIVSASLTQNSMESFASLNKPNLAPPGWLFPIVWNILYILMGIASYLVLISKKSNHNALIVYITQLIFNFFWSIIFFNFKQYLFAFIWLILLWLLILKTIMLFFQISKPASYLMYPYLLWITFAGYLNLSIYLLN